MGNNAVRTLLQEHVKVQSGPQALHYLSQGQLLARWQRGKGSNGGFIYIFVKPHSAVVEIVL